MTQLAALMLLVSLSALPASARTVPGELGSSSLYLVHLDAPPVLARTDLVPDRLRFKADSQAVTAYAEQLAVGQQQAVARIAEALGQPIKARRHYRYVDNAIAVTLSAAQAEIVAGLPSGPTPSSRSMPSTAPPASARPRCGMVRPGCKARAKAW